MENNNPFDMKLTQEQYKEFCERLAWFHISRPCKRLGQAAFNFLHDINPEVANSVRGTAVDCFYNDDLLPNFFEAIKPEEYGNK